MDWLYQRYWLAQIESTNDGATVGGDGEASEAQRTEITRLLTLYKKQQKEALRDTSVPKHKEIGRTIQAIDRWVADVGTSTGNFGRSGAFNRGSTADVDSSGCQTLIQIMTDTGFLVPTSKKYGVDVMTGEHVTNPRLCAFQKTSI